MANYQTYELNGVTATFSHNSDNINLVLNCDFFNRRLAALAVDRPHVLKSCLKRPNLVTAVVTLKPELISAVNQLTALPDSNPSNDSKLTAELLYQVVKAAITQTEPQLAEAAAKISLDLLIDNQLRVTPSQRQDLILTIIQRQPQLFQSMLSKVAHNLSAEQIQFDHQVAIAAVIADGNNYAWVDKALRTAELAVLAATSTTATRPATSDLIKALDLTPELVTALLQQPVNLKVLPQVWWSYSAAVAALESNPTEAIGWLQNGFGDATTPGPLYDHKADLIQRALSHTGLNLGQIRPQYWTVADVISVAAVFSGRLAATQAVFRDLRQVFDYQQRQVIYLAFIKANATALAIIAGSDLNGRLIEAAINQLQTFSSDQTVTDSASANLERIMPTIVQYLVKTDSAAITLATCWAIMKLPADCQPGRFYHYFCDRNGPKAVEGYSDYTVQSELIDWVVSIQPSTVILFTGPSSKPIPGLWQLWLKAVTARPRLIKDLQKVLNEVDCQLHWINRNSNAATLADLGWTDSNIMAIYTAAVTQDGLTLQWVMTSQLPQEAKTQLSYLAVQQNPAAIECCREPSDQLCWLAVTADPKNLQWVAKHYYGLM